MRNELIAIMLCLICVSCKNSEVHELKPLKENQNLSFIKHISGLSDVFREVGVIQLDTSKEALLAAPSNMYLTGNNYFVILDQFKVKKFDSTGKYLGDIGKKGQGPGECNYPMLVAASKENILVYDNSISGVNIYEGNSSKFIKKIKIKYNYCAMTLYDEKGFVMLRYVNSGTTIKECVLDFYDFNGELIFSENRINLSNPKMLRYLPQNNIGLQTSNGYLYLILADDMEIQCYDIKKKEFIWKTDYLPPSVNLEAFKKEPSMKTVNDLMDKHAMFQCFAVFKRGVLQLMTGKEIILYDNNGNYLTYAKYADSPIKNRRITADVNYTYEIVMPSTKTIATKAENCRIKKYELKTN